MSCPERTGRSRSAVESTSPRDRSRVPNVPETLAVPDLRRWEEGIEVVSVSEQSMAGAKEASKSPPVSGREGLEECKELINSPGMISMWIILQNFIDYEKYGRHRQYKSYDCPIDLSKPIDMSTLDS